MAEKPAHGMLDELKHLFKHTSTYSFGNILGKMVGFFMIPFYTHYLSPADYGTLELLDLSLALMGVVLTMWMNASIIRHYYDYDNPKDRNQAVSTILIVAVGLGAAVAFGGIHFSRPLSALILKTPDLHLYVSVIALSFLMTCIRVVSTSYLRAGQRSVFIVGYELALLVITLFLNIYFIAIRHIGVLGVLYSSLIANTLVAIVLTANTIREVSLSFSYQKLKQVVVFGAPLVLSSIAAFTVNFSDRFFLRHFGTIAEVGIYALGYKFAFMLSFLVVQPFDMIWAARMYEIAKRSDSGRMFSKFFEYYSLVLVAVALGLSVVIQDVINIISPAEFHTAYKVVPIVALAYVFQGMNRYFLTGSYIAKKTLHVGSIGVISALANIGLNFLLIPRFGMLGAAWATAASFLVMAALAYAISQRAYAIPYTFSRVVMLIALAAVLYLGSNAITISSLAVGIIFKLAFLAAFPVLLYKAGFFHRREVEIAREAACAFAARYRLRAAAASGR